MASPTTAAPAQLPVVAALSEAGVEVDTDSRRRAEYSYDASNYRLSPLAVIFPHTVDEVRAAVRTCAQHNVPVVPRGGGTGQAGNAIGPGVVFDLSRHMTAIRAVDPDARTADVEAGVVLSHLTDEALARTGGALTFAPDPSSRNRATVGGSIGNDACGNHSVRHGRTGDHVIELDLVTADGALVTAHRGGIRATGDDAHSQRAAERLEAGLREVVEDAMAALRLELGRLPRQVSGYHLEHLLPERGFDVATALAGSEGTLAIVVGARLRLVEMPGSSVLLCLGYRDVVEAATDVPLLLEHDPAAIEGIDDAIVATMRYRRGHDAVADLPDGAAWLYVELDGPDVDDVTARAQQLMERVREEGHLVDGRVVTDPAERVSLWQVREAGGGLSSRLSPDVAQGREEASTGWEDSAVPPENLPGYLAGLRDLLAAHGLQSVLYGHFGAGCMHVRITFDLRTPEGIATFDQFVRQAAELVVSHGGSLSGEHGDGRARSSLLPIMYSRQMLATFWATKAVFDPDGLLNPGVIVDPAPLTADLALADVPRRDWGTDIGPDRGDRGDIDGFASAVQACIGVGKCRSTTGGVMCPSYRATRDEKDSTRGRARVLQEMTRTAPTVREGWASQDVADSLDLCLSCKACSTDCPTGVDVATWKSEFLSHHWAGRIRPLPHYTLGRLPGWMPLINRARRLVNALGSTPLARFGMRRMGLTDRRRLPQIAERHRWVRSAASAGAARPGSGAGQVLLLVDTFTRAFRPDVAGSAAAVLGAAGERVECTADACCGLTYISTGQLDRARRTLREAVSALDDGTDRPIVVLEPSCASAFHEDLPRLVDGDAARRVAARVRSFGRHVRDLGETGALAARADPPPKVLVQTHCHEYSTFGPSTQRAALAAVGVPEVVEATGCCGVAGNFGFEADHYPVSMAVADQSLRPALEDTEDAVPVLTDGFSCQQQVDHLSPGRRGRHLAELLDPRGPGGARSPT